MPAKDYYHDAVKRALIKDGWTITAEQIHLTVGDRYFWIDLQAEKTPDQRVILVEVKELQAVDSPIEALASALGKYLLYRMGLDYAEQATQLYLAVSEASFEGILSSTIGHLSLTQFQIPLLVFDPELEEITQWIR